jgi:hypothetical protein
VPSDRPHAPLSFSAAIFRRDAERLQALGFGPSNDMLWQPMTMASKLVQYAYVKPAKLRRTLKPIMFSVPLKVKSELDK